MTKTQDPTSNATMSATSMNFKRYESFRLQLAELGVDLRKAHDQFPDIFFQRYETNKVADGHWDGWLKKRSHAPNEHWEIYPKVWQTFEEAQSFLDWEYDKYCGHFCTAGESIQPALETFLRLANTGYQVLKAINSLEPSERPPECRVPLWQTEHRCWLDFVISMAGHSHSAMLDVDCGIMGLPDDPYRQASALGRLMARSGRGECHDDELCYDLKRDVFSSSHAAILDALSGKPPAPLARSLFKDSPYALPPTVHPDVALARASSITNELPTGGRSSRRPKRKRGRPRKATKPRRDDDICQAWENGDWGSYDKLGRVYGISGSMVGKILRDRRRRTE